MNPEKLNSIIGIILSLVPFILVGLWLAYKQTKSRQSLQKRAGCSNNKVPRILVVEKATGREAILTVCGFEDAPIQSKGELKNLPSLVKVRYRMENGRFSSEDSDWLAGEIFDIVRVIQIEE